jgi:hypothetical protein
MFSTDAIFFSNTFDLQKIESVDAKSLDAEGCVCIV